MPQEGGNAYAFVPVTQMYEKKETYTLPAINNVDQRVTSWINEECMHTYPSSWPG